MNAKITIALAVVLIALVSAYLLTDNVQTPNDAPGTPAVERPELVPYTTDQITRIMIRAAGERVTLSRDPMGTWGYGRGDTAPTLPADQTRVSGIAARLGNLKAQAKVTDTPSDAQRTEFGLAQPESEVSVGTQTESLVLNVGTLNPRRTGYYAQIPGQQAVYLVESSLVDELKRVTTQPPDPPTPTPSPAGTSTPNPEATQVPQ